MGGGGARMPFSQERVIGERVYMMITKMFPPGILRNVKISLNES